MKNGWHTLEGDGCMIVFPENDIKPHGTRITDKKYELTPECACKPKIILEGTTPIIIHNAWDQREWKENGFNV